MKKSLITFKQCDVTLFVGVEVICPIYFMYDVLF